MKKKLFSLLSLFLFFVGGVFAEEVTIETNSSTFSALESGSYVATAGDVTFTYDKAGSSSAPSGGVKDNQLRIYKSATLTISSARNIQKIVLTTTGGSSYYADGFTVVDGTYSISDDKITGTWEGLSTSVVLTASEHQTRLTQIVVTLEEGDVAVKTPTITPAAGTYIGAQTVTLACATEDAVISYSLDGNSPILEKNPNALQYSEPITISKTATLSAIAIKGTDTSKVATALYTILPSIANTAETAYDAAKAIELINANDAATLAHADNKVYVKGEIKSITEVNTSYGNATYVITDGTNDLTIFRGFDLEGVKFTDETKGKIVEGAKVVVYGNLLNYNGTMEMASGNQLISIVPPPTPVTIAPAEGDITAALTAATTGIDNIGKITINLTEGVTYTVSGSIVAPNGLEINGNGAVIDASACADPFILMSATPSAELISSYYRVGQVKIANVRVDSIKNSIFYDNGVQYCIVDFTIDNAVLNLATVAVQNDALISLKQGGIKDLNVLNSTVYGNGGSKYFVRYNNNARLDRYGYDKNTEFQTMNYQSNTFYNVIKSDGQWGNYNGIGGQNYSKFDVQKNIWYNCGKEIIRRMAGGRFSGKNPMTFSLNTYFYNDADNSAGETSYDNSGNILVTDPTFADAAAGNFTIHAGSQQAKNATGDPRWVVAYDAAQAMPLDIVVNVEAGQKVSEAVAAAAATIDKVGDITLNIPAKTTCVWDTTLVVSGSLIVNGDSSVLDVTALASPMIALAKDTVTPEEWKTISDIKVSGVVINGLTQALFFSSEKQYNITNFVVDNSVIELTKDVTTFDFTKGSVAMNFVVSNSTLYAPTATGKSVYSSQGGQKGSECGATAEAPQIFSIINSTLYNITYNKNFFSHRQNGQTWLKYVIQNNIIVNSGKANFMTSINGGGDSKNPQYDVTTNSVGTLLEGVYTDLSGSQTVQSTVMGTLLTTDPGFKDIATGDFTIFAGSEQAKEKIGDPRWLVEYDEALGIENINSEKAFEDGAWYTIQGIRVEKPTTGLYIHNGKKVLIK